MSNCGQNPQFDVLARFLLQYFQLRGSSVSTPRSCYCNFTFCLSGSLDLSFYMRSIDCSNLYCMKNDFMNYAVNHLGMSSNTLDSYARVMNRAGINNASTPVDDYMNPYILEERQLNVTQMDVFSRLMMDRIIFLGTQVSDQSANIIQAQLLYLDSVDPDKDISLYINSPGGSVYAGLGIYDTMQYINSDVSTICTGMAASMAAVLLVAGENGKRFALPHSRVMIHQPMGGIQGQASDIEITAREILKLKEELYKIISSHSGQPFDKVAADSDRDYWMIASEAKEYGMIDKVLVNPRKEDK